MAEKPPNDFLAQEAAKLGDVFRCLMEGPGNPPEMAELPAGFSVGASQDIDKGKLHLTVKGLKPSRWDVEVAFEDSGKGTGSEPLKTTSIDFALPDSWAKDPGPRFVTVYFRRRGEDEPKNAQKEPPSAKEKKTTAKEKPGTIIRIIPAPVDQSAEDELG